MTVSIGNGLPDIVSVQKRLYPLIFTEIVSEQPTKQPIATAFGFKAIAEPDDGSGFDLFKFSLDRWAAKVTSKKLKTEISLEAIQDLESLGLSSDLIIESIADQAADDINGDIISALNGISSIGSAIALVGTTKFDKSRELYTQVHISAAEIEKTTGCAGTYVVAGGECFGLLTGSGMVKRLGDSNVYKAESGLYIVHDKYASSDYFTVGVKKAMGDYEISSLIFSPYNFDGVVDNGVAYQYETQDPKTFHPVYALIARYALTVAPIDESHTGVHEIDWDSLGSIANSSKLSYTHAVTV